MKTRQLSQSERFLRLERALHGADRDAREWALRRFVGQCFIDRNAHGWNKPGMPKGDRLAIKAEARPFLREAIHWARKALSAGDIEMQELLRDRARMYRAFAALEFFQPYANKEGSRRVAIAAEASKGGRHKAQRPEERALIRELDDLIRGCIARGDQLRVKEWEAKYPLSMSAIYRRAERIREGKL